MAAMTYLDPSCLNLESMCGDPNQHGAVVEAIEGLIRVYKDGHVDRPQVVPCVSTALAPELGVTSRDIAIDKFTNVWARFYVPNCRNSQLDLPLLVYFHGGGFCVGSAAWSCYHEFLARLANRADCIVMSVNYRLAPENVLPAAYEDGFKALIWLKHQAQSGATDWWSRQCDFSNIFIAGDSAGANIAHNVATRIVSERESAALKPLNIQGTILIQPFFGGEARTCSEKYTVQQPGQSALTLAASDTYWRLALPRGTNRDHQWCNPVAKGPMNMAELRRLLPTMVCISEMDILKDRQLEYCDALERAGKKVERVVYTGVGHAFQVLKKSQLSQTRSHEMMAHIRAFISRCSSLKY